MLSPKGGVGTTTIAVNVAVVAARCRGPAGSCIIDLDLQFGQVATHLNLMPKQTIADLTRDEAALREPELLRTYAAHHSVGLQVLAGTGSPELAELVDTGPRRAHPRTALRAYDAVVVDAGSTSTTARWRSLERAEAVVLPVYQEISALKAVHALLDYLNEAGSIGARRRSS